MSGFEDVHKALAQPINPVTLTLIEASSVLAVLDATMPSFADDPQDQVVLQAARDKIYLAIPEDYRDNLPQEIER